MRKMLNTLFVLNPEAYLALDNEAVLILKGEEKLQRVPLIMLESIFSFSYKGASPALMGYCAENNIRLTFMSPQGKFLAAVNGENKGNVLLRKEQFRRSDNETASLQIAKNFIIGKVFNSRWVLERGLRDHPLKINKEKVSDASTNLKEMLVSIRNCENSAELRGVEGNAAEQYFRCLDELILQQKDSFSFRSRSRRPPLDRFNALLSFSYALLANDCAAALACVGLDPYVGFLHRDRPGRCSLALDLMEELRSVLSDRFCLSTVNLQSIKPDHFTIRENGACHMNDEGKKVFLASWQKKKQETIRHPFLDEKIEWGLVPYAQALLLARYLRGDLDEYPPFMWK